MDWLKALFKAPDPREITRKWRREIRKQQNALNRDIRSLELQQKKVEQVRTYVRRTPNARRSTPNA